MPPEDLVDELRKKVVLASDEAELEAALDDLQSALQEHRDYLDSVAADYPLSLPLAIRKRLGKVHKTYARATVGSKLRTSGGRVFAR